MNRIGHAKPPPCLSLHLHQLLPSMIHRATHPPILPPRMLHLSQLPQLLKHLFLAPSLLRQRRKALYAGSRRHELALEPEECRVDLRGDFGGDAGETEECAVNEGVGVVVELREGGDGPVAADLDEGFAGPAEEEEDEEDVAESVGESQLARESPNGAIEGAR